MTPLDTVLKYMDIYYSGGSLDALDSILAEDMVFEGPFYRFDTAEDYIESLRKNPPTGSSYRMIRVFESLYSVNLVYEFIKGDIRTPMSQLFEFESGKVTRILLIFDREAFAGKVLPGVR